MAKIMKMSGSGLIVNRHAKGSKIEIALDPSPDEFLSQARTKKERIKLLIVPGDGATAPIEILASPKVLVLKVEMAQIPPDRLADLETLVTEEQDVHVVVEYTPAQEDLPFEEGTEETEQDTPQSETIVVKCKGMKMAEAQISLVYEGPGAWRSGYDGRLGNYTNRSDPMQGPAFASRPAALKAAQIAVGGWLDSIEVTGTPAQKQDFGRRAGKLREQVGQAVDAAIQNYDEADENDGKDAEIPFEED